MGNNSQFERILETEYSEKYDSICNEIIAGIERYKPTEDSAKFIMIRKGMMVMSYYKYGLMEENHSKGKHMNAIGCLEKRIDSYEYDGNIELMCDVANFAMIEFMYPRNGHYVEECETIECGSENIERIKYYISCYKSTGNTKYLCYIGCIAMLEFTCPEHDKAHYARTDGRYSIDGFGINQIKDFNK